MVIPARLFLTQSTVVWTVESLLRQLVWFRNTQSTQVNSGDAFWGTGSRLAFSGGWEALFSLGDDDDDDDRFLGAEWDHVLYEGVRIGLWHFREAVVRRVEHLPADCLDGVLDLGAQVFDALISPSRAVEAGLCEIVRLAFCSGVPVLNHEESGPVDLEGSDAGVVAVDLRFYALMDVERDHITH